MENSAKEIITDKDKARQEAREKKIKAKQLEKQALRIHQELENYQKKHKKEKKQAPSDAFISLQHINKIYDNHVQAVYDFSLDVKQHEFIVLVGPSGCGKSTTLRMIAGLEDITSGDLYIDGAYANDLRPKDRGIAMVFQSYALYPHMTVAGNLSFSLRIRKFPTLKVDKDGKPVLEINQKLIKTVKKQLADLKEYADFIKSEGKEEEMAKVASDIAETEAKIAYLEKTPVEVYENKHMPKEEIRERVMQAAKILQIEEYLDRKPKALSGGQCQRVALGRAIVRNAKVFLMDEPLSNLDAKLRVAMRAEIIKLHNSLGATTVYVTHDQTEAMTMATRIVVMNKGFVQQIGTPIEIYYHPSNIFVATFIGSPAMNLYNVSYSKGKIDFSDAFSLNLPQEASKAVEEFYRGALTNSEEELNKLDKSFFERTSYLALIEHLDKQLAAEKDAIRKKKTELDLAKAKEELKFCEEVNASRQELLANIEAYKKIDTKKAIPLIFGIRPEDIFLASSNKDDKDASKGFKVTVSVAELLGREYFIHSDFQGKDLISKINSKKLIAAGDKLELSFDLAHLHLFDPISKKTIY